MPFQGNPNAGALDPALIQMLFDSRRQRAELAIAQQKAQMEALQRAKEEERAEAKFQLEMAQGAEALRQARFESLAKAQPLLSSIGERAEAVPAEQRTAAQSQNFFGSIGDGDAQLGEDFASAVLPYDPNVFNPEAQAASTITGDTLLDQDIEALARDRGVQRSDILGGAQTRLNIRGLGEKREIEKAAKTTAANEAAREPYRIDAERRAEQAAIRRENRSVENAVRQAGLVVEEQEASRLSAGNGLLLMRHDIRKQIAEAEAAGRDTTLLNEKLGLLNGRIRSIQDPNTVNNIKPMPAAERIKTIRQYRGSTAGLGRTIELGQALDDGSIKVGASGKVENFKLRAVGMLENLVQIDPNFDADVRSAIQDALGSGQTTVTFTTDAGNQLTLGMDQIQLTYDFIRNGRGGGDRITVGEIERVAKELNFTGLLTTPDQIRGALKKVAKELAREKATARAIYDAFDMNPGDLEGDEIFPDDAQLIEMTFGDGAPRGTVDISAPAPLAPQVPANDPALDAARRLRDAQRGGTGGASGNP